MKISNEIYSDIGWGCLIRVAQMALASSIKRYFESTSQHEVDDTYIITSFLEE